LSALALATFRILPRSGRIAWVSRLRAALAEPPAESPSTRKISVPSTAVLEQSASLPGSRSLRVAVLRCCSRSCCGAAAPRPCDDVLEQDVAGFLVAGQPVLEIVADDRLDQLGRLDADQLLLGLALELRLLDEHRDQAAAPSITSSAVMIEPLRLPVSSA
jgi:hypothetical protein